MKRKILSFVLFGLVLVGCSGGQPVDLETAKARATGIQNKLDAGEVVSPTAYSVDYIVKYETGSEYDSDVKMKFVHDVTNKYVFTDTTVVMGEETQSAKTWVYVEDSKAIVAMESGEDKQYMEGDVSIFESFVNEIMSSSEESEMVLDPVEASKYFISSLQEAYNEYADEEKLKAELPDGIEAQYKFENRSTGEGNLTFDFAFSYSGTYEGVTASAKSEAKFAFDNNLINEVYALTEVTYTMENKSQAMKVLVDGDFSYSASISKPNLNNFTKVEQ